MNSEREPEKKVTMKRQEAYYNNRPNIGTKGPSKLRQQFAKGMTFFLVVAASIIFYFALLRLPHISDAFATTVGVLKPILYGFAIAYLLNPIVKKVELYMVPFLDKRMKNKKKVRTISRTAGVLASLIVLILVIVALCNMLIPELYKSIRNLVFTLPGQLNDWVNALNGMEISDSTMSSLLKTIVNEGTDMFQKWLRTDLLNIANEWMSTLTVGVINVFSELFDLLIGVIVSVYVLFSKETFMRQSKKAVYAFLSAHNANLVLHFTRKSNEIFGGFIIGKIIDSVIIGVLCFVGLSLLKMPYTLLVSVIVGVTNVIPFFGPYIGAIPSAILILLADPMKGVYFIIFILILQQLDGNFIGPKILGNSTGLSAFWVIFAILLGGGLFGFAGMLLGVPTFAVIYYVVQMLVNNRLEKKALPVQSGYYDEYSYVDDSGSYVSSREQVDQMDTEQEPGTDREPGEKENVEEKGE